jgi:hypothetical protein
MREHLFRHEYIKRLGPVLDAILKQRVIELCAGLQVVVRRILGYVNRDCIEFTMQELTRILANLLKSSTRIDGNDNEARKLTIERAC